MNHTDVIADMLTRVRNACKAEHPTVDVPGSKLKEAICKVLKAEGYIADYTVRDEGPAKVINIQLKYLGPKEPVIAGLTRVSKPSRREYVGAGEMPRVVGGMGEAIVSTPEGVMTGTQAKKRNVGGEVLCYIW